MKPRTKNRLDTLNNPVATVNELPWLSIDFILDWVLELPVQIIHLFYSRVADPDVRITNELVVDLSQIQNTAEAFTTPPKYNS